jgi:hypothetical protein
LEQIEKAIGEITDDVRAIRLLLEDLENMMMISVNKWFPLRRGGRQGDVRRHE